MDIEFKPTDKDVQAVKEILGIPYTDTKKDQYFRDNLPYAYEDVVGQTNNSFGGVQPDGSIKVPRPVMKYMAKAMEFDLLKLGVKSRSMGSVSYTYSDDLPVTVKNLLLPYKKVRFHASRR